MTNEWGPPLSGEEMKALKGRIDPETPVQWIDPDGLCGVLPHTYRGMAFNSSVASYHLPTNHPYYKVREYNQKHGTNLVLHDGSDNEPDDWDSGAYLCRDGEMYLMRGYGWKWGEGSYVAEADWDRIAYTPKPKESEVTEQFPKDEAIEYVYAEYFGYLPEKVKDQADQYEEVIEMARLIQQYEPDRLKPAVDIAAEMFLKPRNYKIDEEAIARTAFKAGAAWQKENGNG